LPACVGQLDARRLTAKTQGMRVGFGQPAPSLKKLDWCEVEILDSGREARSRLDAGALLGLAIDAADRAPTLPGALLQAQRELGVPHRSGRCSFCGPPIDLKRATPEQLTGDRGGSWLCSWAVWIAEGDERRRIQHSSSVFGRRKDSRLESLATPPRQRRGFRAAAGRFESSCTRGAGFPGVRVDSEGDVRSRPAAAKPRARWRTLEDPPLDRSGERVFVDGRRPGFAQPSHL
jgi:hypothetical protein